MRQNLRRKVYKESWGFPGSSVVKTPPANAGDINSIPGMGRFPEEENSNVPAVFLPGKLHGQKSLAVGVGEWGYSPSGCKKSDTTQGLNKTITHYISLTCALKLVEIVIKRYIFCNISLSQRLWINFKDSSVI